MRGDEPVRGTLLRQAGSVILTIDTPAMAAALRQVAQVVTWTRMRMISVCLRAQQTA